MGGPAPGTVKLLFCVTSEWVIVSVPPSFEIPPPEPIAWPSSIRSSLSVRIARLRMSPPNSPLLESAFPNASVTPEIVTAGVGFNFGFPTMSNTRAVDWVVS